MFNMTVSKTRQQRNADALARVTALDPDALAWETLRTQLLASVEIATIARILNGVDRKCQGLPPCELTDLSFTQARKFKTLAEQCLARLDEDAEWRAIEAVATIICEGDDRGYSTFASQPASVQTRMRRWAVSCLHAYYEALEGRFV